LTETGGGGATVPARVGVAECGRVALVLGVGEVGAITCVLDCTADDVDAAAGCPFVDELHALNTAIATSAPHSRTTRRNRTRLPYCADDQ